MRQSYLRFLATLIFLMFSMLSYSQEFKIISAEDATPLPFATAINLTHPTISTANSDGTVQIAATTGDSVVVSFVGFEGLSFVYDGQSRQTIRLQKRLSVLPTIVVLNCKKFKKQKIKNKDAVKWITMSNGIPCSYTGLTWYREWTNNIGAIRLNPEKENTILSAFSFWLDKGYRGAFSAIKTPLIIRFYDVSDSLLPGNLISENALVYTPQKTGKQTLRLDSLQLNIPPKGIYVSFQCVMNEEYAWKETFHFTDSAKVNYKDTVYTGYGGRIEGLWSKNTELALFSSFKNKWFLSKSTGFAYGMNGTIKYEAVLKYCDE